MFAMGIGKSQRRISGIARQTILFFPDLSQTARAKRTQRATTAVPVLPSQAQVVSYRRALTSSSQLFLQTDTRISPV